jgi:hypothetical protein
MIDVCLAVELLCFLFDTDRRGGLGCAVQKFERSVRGMNVF